MLKIYGRVNSINVMKVLWTCTELGIDYERVDAGLQYGVVGEEWFRRMNPNGRVPTIEDGGFVLWESNAIVRYLAAKHGAGTFAPGDLHQRALADQWMDWQQSTLHPDITYIFQGTVRNSPDHQHPGQTKAAGKRLRAGWAVLDAALAGRDFVLGGRLTMADIPVGCAVWRYYNLDLERDPLPNVETWHERLQQRPGFREFVMLPLT